jgi:uncharacterized protein
VARIDRPLLLAIVAPLCIWPWLTDWNGNSATDDWLKLLTLVTLIPIIEEVLFRGFLQGWLLNKHWFKQRLSGASRANWLTSLAFAVAHLWQHALFLFPGYFVVSLILGHFRERYRGILVPVLLHAYYNLGWLLFTA